jgi:5-methylcytosine-specific restriction protein A
LSFKPWLNPGDVINNRQLMGIFKCSPHGGMRRSLRTNTLVTVLDHTRSIYEGRWINDVLHFTGMGLEGDQRIDYAQNKTLAESRNSEIDIFLFEVFKQGNYIFKGPVELAGEPYQEEQPDINSNARLVWIFPLKMVNQPSILQITETVHLTKQKQRQRIAKRLSDKELLKRAICSRKSAGARNLLSTVFEANVYVAELAKRRAEGICQLCGQPAPFKDKKGEPYLEPHHIVWLSQGGEDNIENSVALCPNCHTKMHKLNFKSDRKKLKRKALQTNFQYTLFGDVIFKCDE